jgi:Uma2 family endonuclease
MKTATADYRDAIERLPDGTTLVIHQIDWDDYERLLGELAERPRFRISYDSGKLEVRTPLAEHEAYARFIDLVVRVCAEESDTSVESYGATTWKSRALGKGAEPDACYYITGAARVIGKRQIDLGSDPPRQQWSE